MDDCATSGLECLDEDVMGELLPRLDDVDIQNALLCCKSWRTAIRRQIRVIQPIYIPLNVPEVYSSLEQLQLPLVRPVPAVGRTTAAMPAPLTSLAPLRSIGGFSCLFHAAHVDLSGQKLPDNTLKLLSLQMQRLRTLVLDSCVLAPAVLLYATCLTQLQRLSLAEVQFVSPPLFLNARVEQSAEQCVTAPNNELAAVNILKGAAEAASRERQVRSGAMNNARLESQAGQVLLADAWVPRQQQHQQQLQQLLAQQQAGMVFYDHGVGQLVLKATECGFLLDAVLLPQLQRLNLDLKPLTSRSLSHLPHTTSNTCLGLQVQGHLSKLTRLSCLSSLSLGGNAFDSNDWDALCSALSGKLTELHILWDGVDDTLDATAFAQLATFSKLQRLGLSFTNMRNHSVFAEYSLAPLSSTLTSLQLSSGNWCNVELLMSISRCSKVARLELSGLREPFRDEYLVQVVRSMPLLQSLTVSKLHPVARHDYILRQPGDALLSQLDACCPKLTELLIPDVPVDGRGLKPGGSSLPCAQREIYSRLTASVWTADRSTADAAAPGALMEDTTVGASFRGGLQPLQKLQLCATHMMRATLQHLSQLTSLRSITLYGMPLREFPHACRLNCFAPLSALQHLTSLRVLPVPAEQARFAQLPPYVPGQMGAAAAAAAAAVPQHVQQQVQQMVQLALNAVGVHQQHLEQWQPQQQGGLQALDQDDDMDQGAVHNMAHNLLEAIQHVQQMNDLLPEGMPGAAAALDAAAAAAVAAAGGGGGGAAAAAEGNHHVVPPALQHVWNADDADVDAAGDAAGDAAADAADIPIDGNAMLFNNNDSSDDEDEWESGSEGAWEEGEVSGEEADEQQQQQLGPQPGIDDDEMDVDEPPGGGPLPPPQQQQQPVALQPWKKRLSFEPHLHFLSGLPGLVELELGCLQTSGICLLHLHSLPQLRSLILGGNITLAESSWQSLLQLQLPGVTQLSLTGCRFVNMKPGSRTATAMALDNSNSSSCSSGAGSSRAAAAAALTAAVDSILSNRSSMDRLVLVLVRSFPNIIRLELGSCSSMSPDGLEGLVLGLQKLKMLRLLGVKDLKLADKQAELHAQCTAAAAAANAAAAAGKVSGPSPSTVASAHPNNSSSSHPEGLKNHHQQQQKQHSVPYLEQVQQRLRQHSGPNAHLQLKYLEVCEGQLPQSGAAAAAVTTTHAAGHFAAQQGRQLVFVKQEGKMVQVQH